MSHPTRVRGLKRCDNKKGDGTWMSHPTRVRGLKRQNHANNHQNVVAPHTGAWIETLETTLPTIQPKSHPTRVRGLKHFQQKKARL